MFISYPRARYLSANESNEFERAGGPPSHPEGIQERAHLGLGLGQLQVGVRIRHDARPGKQAQASPGGQAASQGDRELAVAGRVDPAHGPGVAAALGVLQLFDEAHRGVAGSAAHGRRRMQGGDEVQ